MSDCDRTSKSGYNVMHKFPIVALQERIPVVRAMFGDDIVRAMIGTILVFTVATIVSYFATILLRRFAPWAIGERAVAGR